MVHPLTRLQQTLAPLGRIWGPFLAQPGRIAGGVACAVLAACALLALPVLAGQVLDVAETGDTRQVLRDSLLFAGAAVVEACLRYVARRLLVGESRRAEESLKNRLQRHITRLPTGWFDRTAAGDVVSRLTQDVEALRFTTGPALLYGTQAVVVVPGGLVLVLATSTWLAVSATIAFLAMAIAIRRLAPAIQRGSRAVQDALGDISQHAAETFGTIRLVQAAHRVAADDREMRRRTGVHLEAGVALARQQARMNLAIHAGVEAVLLSGLVLGTAAVIRDGASTGELLRFYALLGIQLAPLLALGFVVGGLPRALGAAERIEEVLRTDTEPAGGAAPTGPMRIEARALTFAHPNADRPSLSDVSFTIEPGETVGLVGAIGSGKSTLLALLLRLRDPPPGTLRVDGTDVLELDPVALRRRFAVALQDPFLFDDRIAANVRFGADERADVEAAVLDAGLGPDLESFPEGLDTVVGERGVTLSGGQRQRVALARALASDGSVLLLDDTLSAVDQETERRILDTLRQRRAGRTAIVATHRLSAVRDADRIVFLQRGRVLATGTHHELVATCQPYAAAARAQREASALEGDQP